MAVPKGLGSLALFSLTVLALLLVDTSDSVEHFCGGFMTFDFSSRSQYKARVRAITGWVLGLGPCGPNCSENDEGQPTHGRRLQVIAQRNKNDFFGNWTMETAGVGMLPDTHTDITDYVNNNIRGRVSSVNELLQWEQEIAELEIDIDPVPEFTDIFVAGHSWKTFSINPHLPDPIYVLQTKIRPQIRNDTGHPNNSPIALYRPVYRIKINNVTQISITTSDPDGDLVKCRATGFVELDGISPLASTTIRKDCVVEINASEQANFTDGSWGVVALVVEEYNRFPIKLGTRNIPAYDLHGLSATILTFMIQVKTNLTLPEFVEPTPLSQHVYTVYAGSILTIPLYARPGHGSLPGTSIVGFDMLSLPDHNMTVPDPVPYSGETFFSQINWRTEDKDTGDFIIQVVAIDSESYESMDRSYVIEVKDVIFTQESASNENPYFPFSPTLGSFTCPQRSTCSFPIYAAPGQESNTIVDIHLLVGNTTIPGINMSPPHQVLYRGQQVYRSDVQLTSELWGNHSVCFVARDNTNLQTEKCLEVYLIPPNPCDHQPCGSNTITCISHGVTYECICKENFEGVDCSILIDPCLTKNCKNNATCLSNGQMAACRCPIGFSGDQCETNIDDCHLDSCLNHGVCVDEVQGFHCSCQPGYGGINCSTVPSQCRNHQCSNGGVCIVENAQAVCQCPLTARGNTCTSPNLDIPINSSTHTSQPHFVVPTPRNGLQINCTVGETCTLPLFFKGPLNPLPRLHTGLISQGIIADISVPVEDEISGLPGSLTSSLSVTPLEIGSHHVCVELVDANSNNVDNICYEIQSQISLGPEEKSYIGPQGAAFSDLTMPDESDIVCLRGQPCHIIVQTDANGRTRSCVPVQSLSQGVFAFEVSGTTNTTCATDILLDTENPTDRICLRAGIGGEERCFTVHNIQNDPCDPNPCAHNGLCVNSPSLSTGYSCVCHVPYEGPNCSIAGRCSEDVCLNNGVCVNGDVGFQCLCQPGYTEDNCREVPDQCANHGGCDEEALCIVRNNLRVCLCPLGKDGWNCQQINTDLAVNEDVLHDAPHFIEPTPISGMEVVCQIGMQCIIPLYIRSYPDTPCRLIQGWMTDDIHLEFSPLQPDGVTGLPNTLKSSMYVTPTFAGVNQVCAELKDWSSDNVDTVCYTINAKDIVDPPLAVSGEGRFAPSAPLNASQLNCRVEQACHIISETLKTSSEECVPVQPCSLGVHAFQTKSVDANTCGTDILISSDTSTPPGSICLQAGLNGEMRTYDVHFDTGTDSCTSNPCQNNGRCVVSSSSSNGYFCACTVPYKGPTCSQVETTTSAAEVTTSHGHHDITCTESRMEFSIPLSSPHTSETATLSDPNCQINVTRTHVRGGVDLNSCGTTVQFQNDSVIFRNAIIFSAPESSSLGSSGSNSSVSQYQDIIPIQCVYNRIATVHLSYMPVVRRVLFTESGVGQFSFNIQQFWDASFTNMVSDRAYPLRMELDADVFIQLSVGSEGQPVAGHKEIGMEVQQCLVSPSSSVIEAQLHYYPLIQDGCPASSDVHIIPNTNASDSTVMRFRFRAVNFFDPSSSSTSSLVFVHCRMGLCLTGSCKPSAWSCLTPPARRVRRDVDQSKRAAHQLSTGPFLIMADEASTSSSSTTATVMAVVSTSVATVAIVIAAIALIALRRRRTTERN